MHMTTQKSTISHVEILCPKQCNRLTFYSPCGFASYAFAYFGRVDSLDSPFHYISSERLAYCPSQNRTCGFLAYGSSNRHLIPVPYIGCQMRFGNVVIPHSQILFVPEFSFLVSPIQHLVCAVLKIFPEALYRMEIPVHSIVIAMSSDYRG